MTATKLQKQKVTLLIPAYNEQEVLPLLYAELVDMTTSERGENYDWEILFVNDGSTDNTLRLIKSWQKTNRNISYVDLSRNFGKENALLAGFDHATGDCTVILDADLQDPPSLIWQFLEKWEEGFDDVYARRIDRGKESYVRKLLSRLFYHIINHSSNGLIPKNVGDFRLLDSRCVKQLCLMREKERFTKGMYSWIGFKKICIDFKRGDRAAGKSSWSLRRLFSFAVDGLLSFSNFPLRFASVLGSVISMFAFVLTLFYLTKTLIFGDPVTGFPTLIVAILFIGGVQLLCLGIIGEYIGRIFIETKGRPVYIVNEYRNGADFPKDSSDESFCR